jgi:hypothetical protein
LEKLAKFRTVQPELDVMTKLFFGTNVWFTFISFQATICQSFQCQLKAYIEALQYLLLL